MALALTLRFRCAILVMAALNAAIQTKAAEPPGPLANYHWEQIDGREIALVRGKELAWRFNFGPDQTKPNFFPLSVPRTGSLVADRPPDHAWHHGLWFSWKFINGINFWEPAPATDRPEGHTNWKNVQMVTHDDWSAIITLDLVYSSADDVPLLTERRKLRLSPPDDEGTFAIDWSAEFQAVEDLELSCVPIPPAPGGVAWGGYAGLSVRFATDMTRRQVTRLQGRVAMNSDGIFRGASEACDYSGQFAGHPAGIAVLDHARNPRHPVPWYVIANDMSYLNAAFLSIEPLQLAAGSNMKLRYKIVVHAGLWDIGRLKTAYEQFALP